MRYESDLPKPDREYLQSLLQRGEEICWDGRLTSSFWDEHLGGYVFAICWNFVAWIFAYGVLVADVPDPADQSSWIFIIFTVCALLAGLSMLVLPVISFRRNNWKLYAITTHQVIVAAPCASGGYRSKSCPLEDGVVLSRRVRKDGGGSITLQHGDVRFSLNGLPDVWKTDALISRLIEEKNAQPSL